MLSKRGILATYAIYCLPKTEVEEILKLWDEAAAQVATEEELSSVEEKFEEPLI